MLIAQRPTLNEEQAGDFRSRFVIEPLEPGFGYTIGNSVRRTLLSSIPGAAVTSIRIEGVLHEFSTVPGVQEDVTDVILNLKSLVVSSEQDEPVVMYLRKQGPGEVTAADIAPPAGVGAQRSCIATLNARASWRWGGGRAWPWLRVRRPEQAAPAGIGRIPSTPSARRCCGSLQGRATRGAADRLRQAHPRCGNQAVHASPGRGGQRGQDPR